MNPVQNVEATSPVICPICQEDIDQQNTEVKVYETACKHLFHEDCFNKAIKHSPKCPICRSVVSEVSEVVEGPEDAPFPNMATIQNAIGNIQPQTNFAAQDHHYLIIANRGELHHSWSDFNNTAAIIDPWDIETTSDVDFGPIIEDVD